MEKKIYPQTKISTYLPTKKYLWERLTHEDYWQNNVGFRTMIRPILELIDEGKINFIYVTVHLTNGSQIRGFINIKYFNESGNLNVYDLKTNNLIQKSWIKQLQVVDQALVIIDDYTIGRGCVKEGPMSLYNVGYDSLTVEQIFRLSIGSFVDPYYFNNVSSKDISQVIHMVTSSKISDVHATINIRSSRLFNTAENIPAYKVRFIPEMDKKRYHLGDETKYTANEDISRMICNSILYEIKQSAITDQVISEAKTKWNDFCNSMKLYNHKQILTTLLKQNGYL